MSKTRMDTINKKAKTIKTILTIVGIITTVVIAFMGVSLYSIIRTNIAVSDDIDYYHNINGTPFIYDDDSIDMIVNVSIGNEGLFPIEFIKVHFDVYLNNSDNILFPGSSDTYIGPADETITTLNPGEVRNETITFKLQPDANELQCMLFSDGLLELQFKIETQVQYFPINITGSFFTPWSALV